MSSGEVRGSHPDVRVISSTENEGFGRACNRALQDLGDIDHVALINNDATVEAGWLRPLVDASRRRSRAWGPCARRCCSTASCPPTSSDAVINSVGGVLYEGWFGGDRGYLEVDRGQYDEPVEVFSWSGAAVLLRAGYLRDVGHFNPALFLYYEDFELSWRGRLRGWRYRTVPTSVVWHRHGHTTGIGSERFEAWQDHSRWMTLVELAPWPVAVRAVAGGLPSGSRTARGTLSAHGVVADAAVSAPPEPVTVDARDGVDVWMQPQPTTS